MAVSDVELRIIEAATDRFMDAGLYKVTMDEIASDLRMSKKTLYKFFPSKEVLLKALVYALMQRVESEVQGIISSEKPFEEKFTSILTFVGKIMRRFSRPFLTDIQRFAPGLWKEIEIFRREKVFSKIQQMFRQAKKEGVFREDLDHGSIFSRINDDYARHYESACIISTAIFSRRSFSRVSSESSMRVLLTDEARKRFQLKNFNLSSNEPLRYV